LATPSFHFLASKVTEVTHMSYQADVMKLVVTDEEINRAFREKIEVPQDRVVLKENVTFDQFEDFGLCEHKRLRGMRIMLDTKAEDDEFGDIVVRTVNTPVHACAAAIVNLFCSDIMKYVDDGVIMIMGYGIPRRDFYGYQEPQMMLDVCGPNGKLYVGMAIEAAYQEPPEWLVQSLELYFENDDEIQIAMGIQVKFVHLSDPMPDQIPMTLYIFYRDNPELDQEIEFGSDVDHSHPILASLDTSILFKGNVPPGMPNIIQVDIRSRMKQIMMSILRWRSQITQTLQALQ
jgi:hypothetical protein